jgi:hypothetical protein
MTNVVRLAHHLDRKRSVMSDVKLFPYVDAEDNFFLQRQTFGLIHAWKESVSCTTRGDSYLGRLLVYYIGREIPHQTTQQNESCWADDTMSIVMIDFSNTFTQGSVTKFCNPRAQV